MGDVDDDVKFFVYKGILWIAKVWGEKYLYYKLAL